MSQHFSKTTKKIIGAAINYKEVLLNPNVVKPIKPVLFLKSTSAIILEGQDIIIPKVFSNVSHEVELGVIIKKNCKNVKTEDAMKFVSGYFLALDMTATCEIKNARENGLSWDLAKSWDTSLPLSRLISLEELKNPENVRLWLKVNGQMRQDGNTASLIFSIGELISYASKYMTLEENDLILTGTPINNIGVKDGDLIECGIGDLLEMKFNVKNE